MFTAYTWQDYRRSTDRQSLLLHAIRAYKNSPEFLTALEADAYFRGCNTAVSGKTILRAGKLEYHDSTGRRRARAALRDVVGNRIGSGFLFRFVTQQNQYLLSDGVILDSEDTKRRLGQDFDRRLEQMGELALLHGVCWGWWDTDHLEVIPSAEGSLSGFFVLPDEMTGEAKAGVRFWQMDTDRPLYVRLFEPEGVTLLRREGKELVVEQPRRSYQLCRRVLPDGKTLEVEDNWGGRLPIFPLYANSGQCSELTPAIKAKIDAYDNILSDFADNLERANDVYWVLNNFGGTAEDVAETLEQIHRLKAVLSVPDGSGSPATAEPHTIEVPYAARQAALTLLERALYRDYMALDMDELTGGSLTNVAIRTAAASLNLKADRYEWQVIRFVRSLLHLLGLPDNVIRFRRQAIANESETVADIAVMRADIDHRTALRLNPYIQAEEIDALTDGACPA